jgi:hypothetical protein
MRESAAEVTANASASGEEGTAEGEQQTMAEAQQQTMAKVMQQTMAKVTQQTTGVAKGREGGCMTACSPLGHAPGAERSLRSPSQQLLPMPVAMRTRMNSMPGINGGSGGAGQLFRLATSVSRFGMPDRRLTAAYYFSETVWQSKLRLFVTRFDCLSSHDPRGMRLQLMRSAQRGSDECLRSLASATNSCSSRGPMVTYALRRWVWAGVLRCG